MGEFSAPLTQLLFISKINNFCSPDKAKRSNLFVFVCVCAHVWAKIPFAGFVRRFCAALRLLVRQYMRRYCSCIVIGAAAAVVDVGDHDDHGDDDDGDDDAVAAAAAAAAAAADDNDDDNDDDDGGGFSSHNRIVTRARA